MSIYQKAVQRVENPGYDQIVLELDSQNQATNLKAGDTIQIDGDYGSYQINSVISNSLAHGNDPIEAYERAKRLGHDVHFIFGLATCISADSRKGKDRIQLKVGQPVNFEGLTFTIEPDGYHNYRLELIGKHWYNTSKEGDSQEEIIRIIKEENPIDPQ